MASVFDLTGIHFFQISAGLSHGCRRSARPFRENERQQSLRILLGTLASKAKDLVLVRMGLGPHPMDITTLCIELRFRIIDESHGSKREVKQGHYWSYALGSQYSKPMETSIQLTYTAMGTQRIYRRKWKRGNVTNAGSARGAFIVIPVKRKTALLLSAH